MAGRDDKIFKLCPQRFNGTDWAAFERSAGLALGSMILGSDRDQNLWALTARRWAWPGFDEDTDSPSTKLRKQRAEWLLANNRAAHLFEVSVDLPTMKKAWRKYAEIVPARDKKWPATDECIALAPFIWDALRQVANDSNPQTLSHTISRLLEKRIPAKGDPTPVLDSVQESFNVLDAAFVTPLPEILKFHIMLTMLPPEFMTLKEVLLTVPQADCTVETLRKRIETRYAVRKPDLTDSGAAFFANGKAKGKCYGCKKVGCRPSKCGNPPIHKQEILAERARKRGLPGPANPTRTPSGQAQNTANVHEEAQWWSDLNGEQK
jgi:hypothetical protein